MASSMDGASTFTVWKRRSKAASFSMYLRYSFSVVAPTHCNSPRLRAGLMMLLASIAPSAEPAPTMVCNSSMNRMTFFGTPDLVHDGLDALLELAAVFGAGDHEGEVEGNDLLVGAGVSGTLPEEISCARPSTMAVLPTPASPMSTGLFLVRRQRIWMTRSISFFRPMTGSNSFFLANSVRSRPKARSAGVFTSFLLPFSVGILSCSPSGGVKLGSSSLRISLRVRSMSTSRLLSTRAATPSPSRSRPRRMCSVPT